MISAIRLCQSKYAKTAFDGEGARLYPGRWNPSGYRMVYTAESQALAALEMLVHFRKPAVLGSYVWIVAKFDENLVINVRDISPLPRDWQAYPAPPKLKTIGRAWLDSNISAVLKVPSVVIPEESNYLINPTHPDFAKIKIGRPKPFKFDDRLF